MRTLTPRDLVSWALKNSLFVAPTDPGLTREELFAVGERFGLKRGELTEAIGSNVRPMYFGGANRLLPKLGTLDVDFHFCPDPDRRDPAAFDAVLGYFHDTAREMTWKHTKATRTVLVAAATAKGVAQHAAEVAVTMYELADVLEKEKAGDYTLSMTWRGYARPLQQVADGNDRDHDSHVPVEEIHAAVRDVIARRSDGRPAHAEPLDAFAALLPSLGHERFGLWWRQSVDELRRTNDQTMPLTGCVLSASLCEAALIFVVRRALSVGARGFERLDADPRRWNTEDLAKAAATEPNPIFDQKLRDQVVQLNRTRQRIHVGRLMGENPSGPIPDLRPEEARLARATLEAMVRKVVDWLSAHPAQPS